MLDDCALSTRNAAFAGGNNSYGVTTTLTFTKPSAHPIWTGLPASFATQANGVRWAARCM